VKIVLVSAVRPDFMKIAPMIWAMRRLSPQGAADMQFVLIHAGQHSRPQLFDVFSREMDLPAPDYALDAGSGSRTYQTAQLMARLEPILQRENPELVVVVGDFNATVAAALTAAKLGIAIAHVEAGLRSFDRTMPEEINRIVTDSLADYLFVTEESGKENLLREGVDPGKIFFVGNVMIDSLQQSRLLWESSRIREEMGLMYRDYGVVTLHRPTNVDNPDRLREIVGALAEVAKNIPIIFPVHPRTRRQLKLMNGSAPKLRSRTGGIAVDGIYGVEPLGYLDFVALMAGARVMLTDSGGIQEETTFLNIPCLTLRTTTERPVTVTHGTNRVIGTSPAAIVEEASRVLASPRSKLAAPLLWDGRAAERILTVVRQKLRRSGAVSQDLVSAHELERARQTSLDQLER
jgi:UDP-N-acetylglucosamine 2-epimerase (non-hydrolysing)